MLHPDPVTETELHERELMGQLKCYSDFGEEILGEAAVAVRKAVFGLIEPPLSKQAESQWHTSIVIADDVLNGEGLNNLFDDLNDLVEAENIRANDADVRAAEAEEREAAYDKMITEWGDHIRECAGDNEGAFWKGARWAIDVMNTMENIHFPPVWDDESEEASETVTDSDPFAF